jgi:cytochrome c556
MQRSNAAQVKSALKNLEGYRMLKSSKVTLLAAALSFAIGAGVQAAAPDTIKTRQQGLKEMGDAFKTVRDELQGGKDVAKIKAAAATINKSANAMKDWFPAGTGPEAKVKTAAKPEIWADMATFVAARDKLVEEAGKFQTVANSGDLAAVGAGVRGLGGACKGCHDKFRVKED